MIKGPRWEMTEHGWHGVATLTNGTKWHAFVEHVDAPQHCTWAGTAFDSLREAQQWCREEIARLREQQITVPVSPPPLRAWEWLWNTLTRELGEERMIEIRQEFVRRQQTEERH